MPPGGQSRIKTWCENGDPYLKKQNSNAFLCQKCWWNEERIEFLKLRNEIPLIVPHSQVLFDFLKENAENSKMYQKTAGDISTVSLCIAGSYDKTILMSKWYARGSPQKVTSSSNLQIPSAPSKLVLQWPQLHFKYLATRTSLCQIKSWIL